MSPAEITKWKRISLAIALIVIVRGLFVLCVLPPFEGWDEFSHIAYLVHLRETAELPRLETSNTPASMAPMMKQYPHPWGDWAQTGTNGWGTKQYNTFWEPQTPGTPAELKPVPLYEAAQPPFYYLVALPGWIIFSRLSDLSGIYALRVLNVLFLGGAVFVFLQALRWCILSVRHRIVVGLLIGFCPLFVITAARISNDALAIFFSSLTFYFLIRGLTVDPRRNLWFALASVFLGLGILTKANVMAMIPPVAASICLLTYRKELRPAAAVKLAATCALIVIAVLAPLYIYHAVQMHEVYRPTKILSSHSQGKTTLWMWGHFFHVGWSSHLREWLFTRELWDSGWSALTAPTWLTFPYRIFLYAFWLVVVASGLWRGWRRQPPKDHPEYLFGDGKFLILFSVSVLSMLAALAYFATMVLANWGFVFITPSYFMIVFPAWTSLVYQAALLVRRSFALWSAAILLGFYMAAEVVGTLWIMPSVFSASTSLPLMWSRTMSFHPIFPNPWFTVPCLAVIIGLTIYVLRGARNGVRSNLREPVESNP